MGSWYFNGGISGRLGSSLGRGLSGASSGGTFGFALVLLGPVLGGNRTWCCRGTGCCRGFRGLGFGFASIGTEGEEPEFALGGILWGSGFLDLVIVMDVLLNLL